MQTQQRRGRGTVDLPERWLERGLCLRARLFNKFSTDARSVFQRSLPFETTLAYLKDHRAYRQRAQSTHPQARSQFSIFPVKHPVETAPEATAYLNECSAKPEALVVLHFWFQFSTHSKFTYSKFQKGFGHCVKCHLLRSYHKETHIICFFIVVWLSNSGIDTRNLCERH